MIFGFQTTVSIELPSADPLDSILFPFREGSALLDRSVAALALMPAILTTIGAADATQTSRHEGLKAIYAAIASAAFEGDNLLVNYVDDVFRPFVVFLLARQPSGALAVQSIAIDRDDVALTQAREADSGPLDRHPVDRLSAALDALSTDQDDGATSTLRLVIDSTLDHIATATSQLSIVKARLDLQSSFLTAIRDADPASPLVRLEHHLDHAGARDMAMATRGLLGRQSLNIANTNRKTLVSLFRRHAMAKRG